MNAERYQRAQSALSTLLLELTHRGCDGSATLKLRGLGAELSDDIRGTGSARPMRMSIVVGRTQPMATFAW